MIAAIAGKNSVSQSDLLKASEKTKIEYEKVMRAEDHTVAKNSLQMSKKTF